MRMTRGNYLFQCEVLSLAVSNLPKMRNGPQVRLHPDEKSELLHFPFTDNPCNDSRTQMH